MPSYGLSIFMGADTSWERSLEYDIHYWRVLSTIVRILSPSLQIQKFVYIIEKYNYSKLTTNDRRFKRACLRLHAVHKQSGHKMCSLHASNKWNKHNFNSK